MNDSDSSLIGPSQAQSETHGWPVFAAIFAMSFSSLLLELSLTRLFSVALFYHFAFLAISVALLGLGAGGVFAYLLRKVLQPLSTEKICCMVCAINAVLIVMALKIIVAVPVSLYLNKDNMFSLMQIYLVTSVPFFYTGFGISVIFARGSRNISALYGADLTGGALACLAIVPALDHLGAPNAVLLAASAMAVAALLWAGSAKLRIVSLLVLAGVIGLMIMNRDDKIIDLVYEKGTIQSSRDIEFSRWNAISRIEVYKQPSGEHWISIDADAATWIARVDPRYKATVSLSSPASIANVLRPYGDYAIIGPGGGIDVLRAVQEGSPSVTGIEINPLIATEIMRSRYADYVHHLYELPQVHIQVSDGRSWIRGTDQQFDVLQMTLVDTWASTAAGAYSLSENNLYTVEAFREYFAHLHPDGMFCITRWEFPKPHEALRIVSVAMAALRAQGVMDVSHHFLVIAEPSAEWQGGYPVAVLAKKTPFTPQEEETVRQHIAGNKKLELLYSPGSTEHNPFFSLIHSNDAYGFARQYEFNIAPVTDDAPYFFFTLRPMQMWEAGFISVYWNLGISMLLALLVISIVAVCIFLLLPLAIGQGRAVDIMGLGYFIMVGLGYILVEIVLIQRFVLFLGHPTYAVTVVIFLMLLGSGAGSLLSRDRVRTTSVMRRVLSLIVLGIGIYLVVLPAILRGAVGLPFNVKLVLSFLLLVPLAFFMGMPFPAGLRALHHSASNTIEWAWAVNAASSVLGSVLAMVIAIQFGLTVALACSACAYFAALLLAGKLPQSITT